MMRSRTLFVLKGGLQGPSIVKGNLVDPLLRAAYETLWYALQNLKYDIAMISLGESVVEQGCFG